MQIDCPIKERLAWRWGRFSTSHPYCSSSLLNRLTCWTGSSAWFWGWTRDYFSPRIIGQLPRPVLKNEVKLLKCLMHKVQGWRVGAPRFSYSKLMIKHMISCYGEGAIAQHLVPFILSYPGICRLLEVAYYYGKWWNLAIVLQLSLVLVLSSGLLSCWPDVAWQPPSLTL